MFIITLLDIRDLITIDDVMEELDYGPNGGLVYCMEYLIAQADWLEEQLGNFIVFQPNSFLIKIIGEYEDDYLLFDLPGQIELYSHLGVMPRLVSLLRNIGYKYYYYRFCVLQCSC